MIAFGPIPSRRLGRSLGINNITSHKVCTYSCVYCQIGDSKNKSLKRETFYEPAKLIENIEAHLNKLDDDHIPDYLTFVANGEPTLDINLGKEIKLLKQFGIPIAVITNSSIINRKDVQDDLMEADWVSVKVDSLDEEIWRKINRPYEELEFEKILNGLISFSKLYQGKLNTETMLIQGYNDSSNQLLQNASFIANLAPDKSYISIPTRPPALKGVKSVKNDKITEAWNIYQESGLNTELLIGFEGTNTGFTGNAFEDILNITAVHPLREDTMEKLLEQNNASDSVVQSLIELKLIKKNKYNGKTYYLRNYHC